MGADRRRNRRDRLNGAILPPTVDDLVEEAEDAAARQRRLERTRLDDGLAPGIELEDWEPARHWLTLSQVGQLVICA
jgi:hypothetical protein